jgi:hypothetical protein
MKRISPLALLFCFCVVGGEAKAQENFTDGPIWRVILVRIKPGKNTDFWADLRKNLKPVYEEYKKEKVITDYAVYVKSTTENEGDWDVAISLQYPTFAALDGLAARTDPITLKIYGSKEARAAAAAKRPENGTLVASFLMRQVTPKDLPR